jgi:hypothetical protein
MQGPHAGRRGDRGTSTRPAGSHRRIPGIAGNAGERTVGNAFVAQFRCCRLAQQNGPVLPQTGRGRSILFPWLIGRNDLAAAQRRPALRQDEILDGGGHAIHQAKRFTLDPALLAGARRLKRRLAIDQDEGVQIRVQSADAVETCLGDFNRRQASAAVKAEKFRGGDKSWISFHSGVCQCSREERVRHLVNLIMRISSNCNRQLY